MILRADTVGARPVTALEAAKPTILTGDARQEVFQRLNRIALGTFLRAEVLSQLEDGSFLVKVGGGAVRMNLPAEAQVGDMLDLMLAATKPRLTFVLGSPRPDNMTSLSSTGRFIDRLLHTAQQSGAPTAVTGKSPLANTPEVKPDQLANAMKNALAFSGLFYESHVAQWAIGERTLKALLVEPQAKYSDPKLIATTLHADADASGAHVDGDFLEADTLHLMRLAENLQGKPEAAPVLMELLRATMRSLANPLLLPSNAAPDPDAPGGASATGASSPTGPQDALAALSSEAINNESARMISLQLNTLEQQRVTWQGELWAGQPIEWEISEDQPQGQGSEPEERTWQSTVRFEMPVLGAISANVQLAGERLRIQVRTADEAAAALLREYSDMLSTALDAAGSPLELLSVTKDESV